MSPTSRATPVRFTTVSLTGSVNNRTILVTPDVSQNPLVIGTNLVSTTPFVLQPSGGTVTTNLLPWGYTIKVDGWPRSAHIVVPDSTNTQNAADLINTNMFAPISITIGGTGSGGVTNNQVLPGNPSTDGTLTAAGGFVGSAASLTNRSVATRIVHKDGTSLDFTALNTDISRGQALTNAVATATNSDTIQIPSGGFSIKQFPFKTVDGVNIIAQPDSVVWTTNTLRADGSTPMAILIPASYQTVVGGIWSNGPVARPLTIANTGCRAVATGTADAPATNFVMQGATLYGLYDTLQLNNSGVMTNSFLGCDIRTEYDGAGILAGSGYVLFDGCNIIHNNVTTNAVTETSLGLGSFTGTAIFQNGTVHAENPAGLNAMTAVRLFSVGGTGKLKVFNTIIDNQITNVFTRTHDANQDSFTVVLPGGADLCAQGIAGTTNLFYSNVSKLDGSPLNVECDLNPVSKIDSSTVVVARFDSGSSTNGSFTVHLLPRGNAGFYRVTVYQKCTTAGGGNLHSSITYTANGEVNQTVSPASDISLASTSGASSLSVGSLNFLENAFDYSNSTTFYIDLNTTVTGSSGSPKYQIVVTLELIGSN